MEGEGIHVTGAQADKPGLQVTVHTLQESKKYRVDVAAGEDAAPGTMIGVVSIRFADGQSSSPTEVRVFGRIE